MTLNDTNAIKVPTKLFRIGELVRCTPFSRPTIHNYTIMGLIREVEWTEALSCKVRGRCLPRSRMERKARA